MLFNNAQPRIDHLIDEINRTNESQEIKFPYHELWTYDQISSVFDYIVQKRYCFTTRHDANRFVIIIHPKTA